MGLDRRFKAIIFDWDGTAVTHRDADAFELARTLESALTEGIRCAMITGTNFANVERQCVSRISPEAKRRLWVCTNRGSEVYSFVVSGKPIALYQRLASDEENRALDRAASRFQTFLRSHGLVAQIIFDRLNRRKIDLIPMDPWKNPKKSEFPQLLKALEDRLTSTSIHGLSELSRVAMRIAREEGLKDPRITSDIKHIEIGLTDKGDSVRWLRDHVIRPESIAPSDVAIVGDEFGVIGGLQGSDSLMRVEGMEEATFVSVGKEPNGAPEWVTHLGNGPPRFIEFLKAQIALVQSPATVLETNPSWRLEQEGFDPSREREMEPLFTLGNGYLGVRGSLSIPLPSSEDDLFVAGVYDQKAPQLPYFGTLISEGRPQPDAELVPFPSPFSFDLLADGKNLNPDNTEFARMSRNLDLRGAMLFESLGFQIETERLLTLNTLRCASLSDPHLLIQRIEVRSETDRSIELDTRVHTGDLSVNHPHLGISHAISPGPEGNAEEIMFRTRASATEVCYVSRSFLSGAEIPGTRIGPVRVGPERPLTAWRIISVFSSRDCASPLEAARAHCGSIHPMDIEQQLGRHRQEWGGFWDAADIEFEGCAEVSLAQRFGSYQLRISADQDPRVSIGARGLTGRAYEGHVFWDTEIFALPFFLYTNPDIARNLLLYRYNTLQAARERAHAMGCEGACFAWESTLSGQDVTPDRVSIQFNGKLAGFVPIFTGREQIHITADVAYSIAKYWETTLDADFMSRYGIDILVETARFWTTRVTRRGGLLHIDRVVGPDEYHHDVSDNAFTNVMARLNLNESVKMCEWLRDNSASEWKDATERLRLREGEMKGWEEAARSLFIPAPDENGVIEQFEGFFKLGAMAPSVEPQLRAPIRRLSAWDEVNRSKVIKQADVLMLPYLFPEQYSREMCAANFDYYEPITDHGSSLSPCVHAAIAFRAGRLEAARKYWENARSLDLMNEMRNTSLGIHIGAAGGAWQTLLFHFLGLKDLRPASPLLPNGCGYVSLKLRYRGTSRPILIQPPGREGEAA